jgi:two-component system, NarL family, response regulator NreC
MTTLILADDHHVVRQGLRTLLETEPDFEIVGEAGDGLEVVQLVEQLRPDVLVADLMLPGINGLEVTRQVSQRTPQTQIIILSMYADEAYVVEALRNGAAGYVVKRSTAIDLVQAVREVIAGRRYLSVPFSQASIETYLQNSQKSVQDSYDLLTTREREVLQLAARGHPNAEIATRLVISPRTVEMHRANLMRKLNLHTQVDLLRYALKRGIVPLDEDS